MGVFLPCNVIGREDEVLKWLQTAAAAAAAAAVRAGLQPLTHIQTHTSREELCSPPLTHFA